MTAEEGVQAAHRFPKAAIVPLHFSGWQHFSESWSVIQGAFAAAGLDHRLRCLKPGIPTAVSPS